MNIEKISKNSVSYFESLIPLQKKMAADQEGVRSISKIRGGGFIKLAPLQKQAFSLKFAQSKVLGAFPFIFKK